MNNMIYRTISIFTGALLLAATVFVIIKWQTMPDQIPTHYNFAGKPDAYGGKGFIIFEAVTAWFLYIMITVLGKFPNRWNIPFKITPQNRAKMYSITKGMLEIVNLLTVLIFIVIMVSSAMAVSLPSWLIMLIVAILFAVIAAAMLLMYKNR